MQRILKENSISHSIRAHVDTGWENHQPFSKFGITDRYTQLELQVKSYKIIFLL